MIFKCGTPWRAVHWFHLVPEEDCDLQILHSVVICLFVSAGARGRLLSLNVALPGDLFIGFLWCRRRAVIFKCDTPW